MPEGSVRAEGETITALRASVRSVEVDEHIIIVGEMPEKMDSVAETERPRLGKTGAGLANTLHR